jgi:quinol monooxygenase YgiN
MSLTKSVSLHPYFQVLGGKQAEVDALLARFVAKTAQEPACLYYEFTRCQDVIFCREAYTDADGVLAHLENVGPELKEMQELSEMIRFEVHGPDAELAKLKSPLSGLPVEWFEYFCGVVR